MLYMFVSLDPWVVGRVDFEGLLSDPGIRPLPSTRTLPVLVFETLTQLPTPLNCTVHFSRPGSQPRHHHMRLEGLLHSAFVPAEQLAKVAYISATPWLSSGRQHGEELSRKRPSVGVLDGGT